MGQMTVEEEVQIILDHLQQNEFILKTPLTRAEDQLAAGASS